ncbi:MAG: phosphatase PAP2 family protein [Candidatus Nitrosocaldus sp.]|nr:phosphatase PAP2 family protein [Candidatus Nitrosocaldus sp.]MCS7141004.1 phosphatase PAP2 family protein [Candidatus Nitrosocaldus sp.]MDW7999918.1 phosphatase PAP2 family protein [Candidatus Nitrosocaldus sp.]MDW8275437.1 phosphatase PAP2 family protein [Candidatus Nitrosocaldus sp.]
MLGRAALVPLRSITFLSLLIAFAVVSILVASGVTDGLDKGIFDAVTGSRSHTMDLIMVAITTTADIFPVYFSPLLIIAIILLVRKRSRRIGAILILVILVAALASLQVKGIVYRDRPDYEFRVEGLEYRVELDAIAVNTSSYPSGHAARSAAFALVMSYMLRDKRIGRVSMGMLLWLYPLLISLSRVYVGEHYPMDVLGGTLLGLIVGNFMAIVFRLHSPS